MRGTDFTLDAYEHILSRALESDYEFRSFDSIGSEQGERSCLLRHDIDADIKEPHCLVAVDLDADGDIDVATCAFGDAVVVWYENDGHGVFTRHLIGTQQQAYDIRAIDMDLDGDLDLLIAGRGSKNVVWYANPLR